jgi:hypothetical protein
LWESFECKISCVGGAGTAKRSKLIDCCDKTTRMKITDYGCDDECSKVSFTLDEIYVYSLSEKIALRCKLLEREKRFDFH